MNSFDGHNSPSGVTPASQAGDDVLPDSSLGVVEAAHNELDVQETGTSLDVIEDAYAELDREEVADDSLAPETEERDSLLEEDEYFMGLAFEEAHKAAAIGEVPIGAVVVCDGEVVARAYNRREIDADPAGHAEFLAMREASRILNRWRLSGCTVYVTLEPCIMCAGLMYQARIDRCVYAATDPKAGALGTLYAINEDERLNHTFAVTSGVLEAFGSKILKEFFAGLRSR